jgi:hypothetical protein
MVFSREGVFMQVQPQTYAQRDETLRGLGYESYVAYLASPLWAKVRVKAFIQNGRKCKLCKRKADLLHHKNYGRATLLGRSLEALVPICKDCHTELEFDSKGNKRPLWSVQSALHLALNKMYETDGNCNACSEPSVKGLHYCGPCWKQFKKGLPLGRNFTPSKRSKRRAAAKEKSSSTPRTD